ncbi:hypothetical protein CNO14_04350 (plasmid) [Borrelia miyamotoi]|uniref:Lipoprotein n=1 Tax=Borrelia miyamotoi TaxID=47466 RepID=A0AAP8YSJ7_9SPIR|nr:hypothetical protein [Borrelia miyamotoi]AHH05442.1 hypothetical protein BOM_0899 [Borrelia miyamotoi FR64b]ATQ15238.1 hypothetical protein CNO14_04350 [Borrelia miyamotoi]ATQ16450.1 hypothetical protein CNO13_04515 [Borrelia miyamotoi]ATQ17567.1 hypothetical protein CNO12_04355 [Borrelia miyamotoi]ATQ18811.1 hypothetical protein CNO11_04345 [Borrelia miyamotoi]
MKSLNYNFICIILFVVFMMACGYPLKLRPEGCENSLNRLKNKEVLSVDVTKAKKGQVEVAPSVVDIVGNIEDESLVFDVEIKEQVEDISLSSDEVKLSSSQKDALISLLVNSLDNYKNRLKEQSDAFNKTNASMEEEFAIKLPLHKVQTVIDSVATQAVIFETLGYSETTLKRLQKILNILDFENLISRDVRVANSLILCLDNVFSLTKKVLYDYVNELNLEQIVTNNGEDGINAICRRIDQFMELRDRFIEQAKNDINLAFNNDAHMQRKKITYKDALLDVLERVIGPNGTLTEALAAMEQCADEIYAYLSP